MADPTKFTAKEVLNKVLLDSSGNAVSANSVTSQEALSMALDATNNRLNVALEGGTISGDVTISGDLTVSGGGSLAFDEILEGTQVIDVDSTEALLVRKNGDNGDIFTVDTTNEDVAIGGSLAVSGDTANGSYLGHINNTGSQSEDNGLHIQIASSGSGAHGLKVQTGGSANAFIVSGDGQVGLGFSSSSMVQTLNVNGGTYISGNALVGHTASMNSGGSTPKLQVSDNDNDASIGVYNYGSNAAHFASLRLAHSKNGTVGSHTVLADNDKIGAIEFNGSDGSNFDTIGARIIAEVDGSPTGNRMPSALTFSTAVGSSDDDITERMRISSAGNIGIGTNDPTFFFTAIGDATGDQATINQTHASYAGSALKIGAVRAANSAYNLLYCATGTSAAGTSGTAQFVVRGDGSVGVGGTPTSKLHVHDSVDGASIVHFDNVAGGSSSVNETMALHLNLGDGSTIRGGAKVTAKKEADFSTGANMDSSLMFSVLQNNAFNDALFISSAGNTGIGVSEPSHPLSVNGAVTVFGQNTVHDVSAMVLSQESSIKSQIRLYGSDGSTHGSLEIVTSASDGSPTSTAMILDANSRISLSNNDGNTYNTVFGYKALTNSGTVLGNVGADYNVAIGHEAMGTAATTTDATLNVAVGYLALRSITSGDSNVAIGGSALAAVSSASHNIGIGTEALATHTNGSRNIAIGFEAMHDTDDHADVKGSSDNVFIGYQSGSGTWDTNDSNYNIGIGNYALDAALNGIEGAVAIGHNALGALTTGGSNTAIGFESQLLQTDGGNNTSLGYKALRAANSGESLNTVIGTKACEFLDNASSDGNTIVGTQANVGGTGVRSYNTAMGYRAMGSANSQNNIGGNENVFLGAYSGNGTWTGTESDGNTAVGYDSMSGALNEADINTAVGKNTLKALTTGDYNTAVGGLAADAVTTGEKNVCIGYGTEPSAVDSENQVCIGFETIGQADNSVTLGNASVTDVYMASDKGATVHLANINFHGGGVLSGGANTLDDYEEGTWTPVFTGGSSAGSYSMSNTVARYTKIGRVVHVSCSAFNVTQSSAGSGAIEITGLPFTVENTSNSKANVGALELDLFSFTGSLSCTARAGSTVVEFHASATGAVDVTLQVGARDGDDSDFAFNITYTV